MFRRVGLGKWSRYDSLRTGWSARGSAMKGRADVALPVDPLVLRTLGALHHGVALLGSDGRVWCINQAFVRLTGWLPDDMAGQLLSVEGGLLPSLGERPDWARAVEFGEAFSAGLWCRRRDGSAFWCEVSLAAVRDDLGARLYGVLELRDIDAHRLADDLQRSNEKRHRDLVEHIPAGVVVHGPGSEILLANREASRVLGLRTYP